MRIKTTTPDPFSTPDTGTYTENLCERFFYPVHDRNYNIIGLATKTGRLVERYEYDSYGRRTVYSHGVLSTDLDEDGDVDSDDSDFVSGAYGSTDPAHRADLDGDGEVQFSDFNIISTAYGASLPANDPLVTHPRALSARLSVQVDTMQPYGLCPFGFQGLPHDEVTGNLCQRLRIWHPLLGKFIQRDPLGYPDGLNAYAGYHVMWGGVDPMGLEVIGKPDPQIDIESDLYISEDGTYIELNIIAHHGNRWSAWNDGGKDRGFHVVGNLRKWDDKECVCKFYVLLRYFTDETQVRVRTVTVMRFAFSAEEPVERQDAEKIMAVAGLLPGPAGSGTMMGVAAVVQAFTTKLKLEQRTFKDNELDGYQKEYRERRVWDNIIRLKLAATAEIPKEDCETSGKLKGGTFWAREPGGWETDPAFYFIPGETPQHYFDEE